MNTPSIRSGTSSPRGYATESLYGSSRAPSPAEIMEARRIVIHDPNGAIQMVDLSAGVQDAFARARRDLDSRSPSPGPSLPSRASSPAGSVRTMRSYADSTTRIIPPPPAAEIPEETSKFKRAVIMAINVTGGASVLAFISAVTWYIFKKVSEDK